MSWGWIEQNFERVSEQYNPLLAQLVTNGKLRIRSPDGEPDSIDVRSISLIGAALARRSSLLLVFPDLNPRRPALVFAYALLSYWERLRSIDIHQQRPVLYCGVQPGIREQLSRVAVTGMSTPLGDIFDQTHLSRGARSHATARSIESNDNHLPRVVTSFAPADPAALIASVRPAWIAVDLGDASKAEWLPSLLTAAKTESIPVVAWGTNPLSETTDQFSSHGHIVKWPMCRSFDRCAVFGKSESCEALFHPYAETTIHPVLMKGRDFSSHNDALQGATDCLRKAMEGASSPFVQSAIQIHWRLLRTIDSLAVPHSFYEAEAPRYWGLRSIAKLRETCRHFQEALQKTNRSAAQLLERSTDFMDEAVAFLSANEPPLWAALIQLVHGAVPLDRARLVVFPSQSRKDIFMSALLAKFNISALELEPLHTWITSLAELRALANPDQQAAFGTSLLGIPPGLDVIPLIPGIPPHSQTSKLLPVFFAEDVEILLHGYQTRVLAQAVRRWNERLSPDILAVADTIADLGPLPRLQTSIQLPPSVGLAPAIELDIDNGRVDDQTPSSDATLWSPLDMHEEVGYLFDSEDTTALLRDVPEEVEGELSVPSALWIDRAFQITFSNGWQGLFAPDQQLNFVAPGSHKIEERYVRALREHDTVLIIPNQRRQDLYSLIISRVHQHPSIELHLALLRRWHDEFSVGFQRWAAAKRIPDTRAVDALLSELRQAGSSLKSSLTIRFWLRGSTLSPLDPDDLVRVAEIMGLRFVSSHHKKINNAAARIRGLHRGLSNRLNRWLEDQAHGLADLHGAEIIDQELGLTFGDIRDSLVLAQITTIREIDGPFLSDSLGLIERATSNDTRRAIA